MTRPSQLKSGDVIEIEHGYGLSRFLVRGTTTSENGNTILYVDRIILPYDRLVNIPGTGAADRKLSEHDFEPYLEKVGELRPLWLRIIPGLKPYNGDT